MARLSVKFIRPKEKIDYIKRFRNQIKYGPIKEFLFEMMVIAIFVEILLLVAVIRLK